MEGIENNSVERLILHITSPVDPTGLGNPEFGVTIVDTEEPPTDWFAGSWDGNWNSALGAVRALTPTMFGAGADIELDEGEHQLWCRFTMSGTESPVVSAGVVTVI